MRKKIFTIFGAVGQLSGGFWELVGAFGRFLVGLIGLKLPSPVSFGADGLVNSMNSLEFPLLFWALGVPCVVDDDASKESNAKN